MAKRNLARTAIEGGRVSSIRVNERFHTRAERSQVRAVVQSIKKDPDSYDELIIDRRKKEYKEFADRLNPVYRWLEKQAGRPWNEVFSEIKAKFPGRSLAGRHILGHIDGFISKEWFDNERFKSGLVVGRDGILRKFEERGRRYRFGDWVPRVQPELEAHVHWLLDHGWHGELNQYLKQHHSPLLSSRTSYRSPETFTTSQVKARILMGKHDVEQFVVDIMRGKVDSKIKEHHAEWKTNLESFIKKILVPVPA